jgi:hypothetical protein
MVAKKPKWKSRLQVKSGSVKRGDIAILRGAMDRQEAFSWRKGRRGLLYGLFIRGLEARL